MQPKSSLAAPENPARRRFLAQALLATSVALAGLPARRLQAAELLETYALAMPEVIGGGWQPAADTRLGLILGPGTSIRPDGKPYYYLSVIDLDAPVGDNYPLRQIALDFFAHGVVPDPLMPERAVLFQKKGAGACEIDLRSGELLRPIVTAAERRFYGHGAFSLDGALLYATETIVSGDYEGLVSVRDARDHQLLGQFPSYGSSPHDCQLIDSGRVLAITNGGGPRGGVAPSVTYVDVDSQRLLERLEFSRADINAGHLAISASGDLAVVSAQREGLNPRADTGGVSLRAAAGSLKTMTEPPEVVQRMVGETLSVCIDEQRRVVAATTPVANMLTFWDLDSGRLLKQYAAHNPRGISLSLDRQHYVLSYEKPPQISLLSTQTLKQVAGADLGQTGMSGSHIISYSLPAAV